MTTPRFVRPAALALLAAVIAVGGFAMRSTEAAPATPSARTLENLNAAFNGESNAHARYLAFAAKADEEGYGEVASLFRAAARAESVHAANHAEVIKKLGGVPKADIQAPDVRSTTENLEAAIKGESYERDTMYPEFLAQARKEGQRDAIQTFNFAKSVEAEHAKLYTAALANLGALKGSQAKPFYVCTVCGNTTTQMNFEKCPVCFNAKDKYVQVS